MDSKKNNFVLVQFRIPTEDYELLKKACKLVSSPLSNFVRSLAVKEARTIVDNSENQIGTLFEDFLKHRGSVESLESHELGKEGRKND